MAGRRFERKDSSDDALMEFYHGFRGLDENGSKSLSFDEFMSMARGSGKDHDKMEDRIGKEYDDAMKDLSHHKQCVPHACREHGPFRRDGDCCGVAGETFCTEGFVQSIQENGCETQSDRHIGTCCTPVEEK